MSSPGSSEKTQEIFDRIRLPLAIFLSSLVFIGYISFFKPERPLPSAPAKKNSITQEDQKHIEQKEAGSEKIQVKEVKTQKEIFYALTNKFLSLKFSSHNAAVKEAKLHLYSHRDGSLIQIRDLEEGALKSFQTASLSFQKDIRIDPGKTIYSKIEGGNQYLVLMGEEEVSGGRLRIKKRFELTNHSLKLSVEVYNSGEAPASGDFLIFNGSSLGKIAEEGNKTVFDGIKLSYNNGDLRDALKAHFWSQESSYARIEDPSAWMATQNRFFARYLMPMQRQYSSIYWKNTLAGQNELHRRLSNSLPA